MMAIRTCIIATLALGFSGCSLDAPLPADYYSGTDKIAGGKPPTVPVLTFNAATLRFDFTAAVDPETNAEVPTYFVYIYSGVPKTYYQVRDIDNALNTPLPQRAFSITRSGSGTFTVVLTGYDGNRESQITTQNQVTFNLP